MTVAVVTGCSTGIGFATALRLGTEGFDVVATMRRPERDGERLVDVARAAGSKLRVAEMDVTDDESVCRLFDATGDVDVLVNNAAVVWFGSAEETDVARWVEVFDTNLFGTVRCMRAVLPHFRRRQSGCIVNVSSAAGSVALPGVSAYGASKAALEAASEMVAIEGHQHGIRVVVLETGATATAMGAKMPPPPRSSPYWGAMRNTLAFLAAQQPQISPPEVIADAIARAVLDPTTPFRVSAGQGSTELIGARRATGDEEWIAAAGGTLDEFNATYERVTGVALRPRSG
jgi:NAD(P)-dependent dehydrogenase (short-subunit alcohol dehydrogenase family)